MGQYCREREAGETMARPQITNATDLDTGTYQEGKSNGRWRIGWIILGVARHFKML